MGKKIIKVIGILLMVSILVGCGAGGDSIDGLPSGGSSGGGGNYHINITSYDMNPKVLSDGTSFQVTWTVDYSGVAGYWVEFHMNSENSINENMTGLTRHFYYNCEMGPGTCGKSGNVMGTVNKYQYDDRLYTLCSPNWTNIGSQAHDIIFRGNGYAILRACTYDGRMNKICDQKSVQITVQ